MSLNVVQIPSADIGDVPARLRSLAKNIEDGQFGDAHNVAWVIDCGNGRIEVGLIGPIAELAPSLHYLLSLGVQRVIRAGTE